jgi:hypothetical protein
MYDRIWRRRAFSVLTGVSFPADLEIEIVARTVELEAVEIMLDNACGNVGAVIANDLSLPMLEHALGRATREGIADRILFVRSDSERMPFASGCFDAITCGASLNEYRDPGAFLGESRRVLEIDGRMSLMCQVRAPRTMSAAAQRLIATISGLRFPPYEELIEILGTYFSVEAVLHVGAVVLSKLKRHESRSRGNSGPPIVDPRDLTILAPISRN